MPPDQYESELTTSPRGRREPSAHQVGRLIESFMNRTEPSHIPRLTPPGWLLVAVAELSGGTLSQVGSAGFSHDGELGAV